MKVKVLEILDRHTLTQPITNIVRARVELDGRNEAYVVCYEHNNHVMHLQGNYFIVKGESKKFFDLHIKEADLGIDDMTPDEKADYESFRPRSHREMAEYING